VLYIADKFAIFCFSIDGVVQATGGVILGDVPFSPEVYTDGSFHPVCFPNDADNNEYAASAFCLAANFSNGGRVVAMTGETYDKDALPIGQCSPSETLAHCVGKRNELDPDERCKAGTPVGIKIACNYQCRPFETFNQEYLPTCHPYLNNSTKYYLAETPWMDSPIPELGFSVIGQLADIVANAMNPTCAANVMSLFCRTLFRECGQVEDRATGNRVYYPSLLCRSECERHRETWNVCLEDLEENPDAKRNFDNQMIEMVNGAALVSSLFFGEGARPILVDS